MSKKKFKIRNFSLFVSFIAALGGFLFGYNTSVISGAILFIANDFSLSVFQQELIVSTLLIGALLGALMGGFIADAVGRKKTLYLTLVLFFFGTLTLQNAGGFHSLLWGRLITGFAIGIASLAVPLYIAEISPKEKRGAFVSLNQLLITIGILVSYLISLYYADRHSWRDMFAFGYFPVILQFVGLFFAPETPSWLFSKRRIHEAEEVLHRLKMAHPNHKLTNVTKEEEASSKRGWKELFSPSIRRPFFVGIGISVFQQITGINTVIYYAPRIFQAGGYQSAEQAIFATVLIGCVNVVFTLLALWLLDRVGRRPLLMVGLIGMGSALLILGFSFFKGGHVGLTAIGGLMVYVAFFAVSLGPVAWLIISEIYPLGIRGRAMGIATFANWTSNYLVSLTFLTLIEKFGTGITFWIYTFICLLALWFVIRFVPETRGKTFEEIQNFWKNGNSRN